MNFFIHKIDDPNTLKDYFKIWKNICIYMCVYICTHILTETEREKKREKEREEKKMVSKSTYFFYQDSPFVNKVKKPLGTCALS